MIRLQHAGDQIKQGGLAGAVGADKRLNLARADLERDPFYGLEPSEGDADVF